MSRLANDRVLASNTGVHSVLYVKTTFAKKRSGADAGPAGHAAGSAAGADLGKGHRLRQALDPRHRQPRPERRAAGQIESPEIGQQLSQACRPPADGGSLALARSTVDRWEQCAKDLVSQQELDERRSAAAQAGANLAAAEANVQRLRQLQGFTRVVAPFAGVITRRNVDVGDLIDSGGKVLFVLTQVDPLRIYVNVPQSYAQLVKPGQKVVVTQGELRGQSFTGTVARTAGSIDAASRTMQVEIALANKDRVLLPGAYVQVSMPLAASETLVVPTNVLLFRPEGIRVAVVDASSKVKLRPVTMGRNLGEAIEILDGIGTADRLVVNPSDSLADGDVVSVAGDDAAAGAAAVGGASRPAGAGKAQP